LQETIEMLEYEDERTLPLNHCLNALSATVEDAVAEQAENPGSES
jgi:hypothetical protein